MNNALKILQDNYNGEKGSFIYYLHEESRFDKEAFQQYFQSLVHLTNKSVNKPLDRQLTLMVVKTHDYILRLLIFHFSPCDLSRIKNLPDEELFDFIDNLRVVTESFVEGVRVNEDIF